MRLDVPKLLPIKPSNIPNIKFKKIYVLIDIDDIKELIKKWLLLFRIFKLKTIVITIHDNMAPTIPWKMPSTINGERIINLSAPCRINVSTISFRLSKLNLIILDTLKILTIITKIPIMKINE